MIIVALVYIFTYSNTYIHTPSCSKIISSREGGNELIVIEGVNELRDRVKTIRLLVHKIIYRIVSM